MSLITIILFFVYAFGLGFALCRFVKESDSFLEKNLIRIGVGLSVLPIVGIIFSLLHIPVDWKIFLLLSLMVPAFYVFRNYKNFKFNLNFKFRKSDLALFLVIFVFFLSFNMYHKGAFAYPYLEDDDPWSHANGVKYVSVEKTFFNPFGGTGYLDPYPPVYDGLLGLLDQTSASVNWTLKFFNALLISLSLIFFYLFVKEFTNDLFLALFATVALSMIPAFLSHFIWAHSLIPLFIFLSFLFMERIKHDKKWMYMAPLPVVALILTTIDQSSKFMMLFLIYFAVKSIVEKRFHTEIFIAGILGFIISLIWWIPISFRFGGIFNLLNSLGLSQGLSQGRFGFLYGYLSSILFYVFFITAILIFLFIPYYMKKKLKSHHKSFIGILLAVIILFSYIAAYSSISEAGTADRIYDFNDFFIAKKQNMINNPIGIGAVVMSLLFITFLLILYEQFSIVKKNRSNIPKKLFYSLYALSILNSAILLISLISFFSFRFKAGTLLKTYMLENPENYNYVYSFTFKTWGIYLFIISVLIMIAIYVYLIYKGIIQKSKVWLPISLFWFLYTFAGIYDIPTQLFTFRIWMLLAFTISILAGYGFITIISIFGKSLISKSVIWLILIVLIFYTSGVQKYAVNTAIWPPGAFWTSNEEIQGYMWFKGSIPSGARVFTFSSNALVISLDKFICSWCKEVIDYQRLGFNETSQQNYNWLKKEQYKYLIIDGQAARKFGANETNGKLNELLNSGLFRPVHNTGGFILLQTI